MTSAAAEFELTTPLLTRLRSFLERHARLIRLVLFLYVFVVACPIRYFPLESGIDATWRFALNYAPAHGYAIGRDYVYTTGPLVYLIFPEDVGNNLKYGLIFQGCLWLVLGTIFADVFVRGGFRIQNLALFSFCFGLAAPLFWFNSLGPENLMVAGALLLIVMFQVNGGWTRYVAALLTIGALPLFKMSAGVLGASALMGFLTARLIDRRRKAWPEILLAALVPVTITCGVCLLLLPSVSALLRFLRGSFEVMGGYSSAMATATGSPVELALAVEAGAVLLAALYLQSSTGRALPRFYLLLLAGPVLVSFKHGFVRQDEHTVNFFCFVALGLALVSLTIGLRGVTKRPFTDRPITARPITARPIVERRIFWLLLVFSVIWQDTVGRQYGLFKVPASTVNLSALTKSAFARSSGVEAVRMLSGAFPFSRLKRYLDSGAGYSGGPRIEPDLIALIGDSPVASLSWDFTDLVNAGLNLTMYPTLQRAIAYTPFLDEWNAAWIGDKGPRYLVFDGASIDNRDPWAETPAMWLEIYRWYDTRFLTEHNLLLERRTAPRFKALESIRRSSAGLSGELLIPPSAGPVFWTMKCRYSTEGLIRRAFAGIPAVTFSAHEVGGALRESGRLIPDVLVSPVLGNYLPYDLAQFAAIFRPGTNSGDSYPGYSVDWLSFGGAGAASWAFPCEVEFLRPVR